MDTLGEIASVHQNMQVADDDAQIYAASVRRTAHREPPTELDRIMDSFEADLAFLARKWRWQDHFINRDGYDLFDPIPGSA